MFETCLFSTEVKCAMKFGIFLPPQAESGKCPVLYWLSGNLLNSKDVQNKLIGLLLTKLILTSFYTPIFRSSTHKIKKNINIDQFLYAHF